MSPTVPSAFTAVPRDTTPAVIGTQIRPGDPTIRSEMAYRRYLRHQYDQSPNSFSQKRQRKEAEDCHSPSKAVRIAAKQARSTEKESGSEPEERTSKTTNIQLLYIILLLAFKNIGAEIYNNAYINIYGNIYTNIEYQPIRSYSCS